METIKVWLKGLLDALKRPKKANTAPAKTTTKSQPHESYVFVTTKGKKYHWSRLCPGLRNSREVKMDLSKARKAGYTACDKCCYKSFQDID